MLRNSELIKVPNMPDCSDYDLLKLLRHYNFDATSTLQRHRLKVGLKSNMSDIKRNERLPLLWVLEFLSREDQDLHAFFSGKDVRFHSSKGMPGKNLLRPYLSNLKIFPDGSILVEANSHELVPISARSSF